MRRADGMTDIGVQDRTKEAFQSMAVGELPALYSLARRLVRDGAEDLVQETLIRAYRSFGALKEDEAGARWLKTILVNVFRDELRRRARSVEELPVEEVEDFSLYRTLVEVDPLPYSDTLHLDFLRAFGKDDVRDVLMRLPELYRAPLVLRYMDGFATKEIARMLDTPLGTILARLHRGRKAIRDRDVGVRGGDGSPHGGGTEMTDQQGSIPCSEAVKQLWDYLDHAISANDQERVEKHLSFCRTCCGELEFAKELRSFLASNEVEEIPPDVKAHLERFVQEL